MKKTPEHRTEHSDPEKMEQEYTASGRMNLTDDIPLETVLALKEGDHLAFERVYVRYMAPIRNFLRVLTRCDETAEELTQQVFVTLWERRDGIDPRKSIKNYLYVVARNRVIRHIRSRKTETRYLDFAAAAGNNGLDAGADELLIAKEQEILVGIAISRMPAQRKRIYELSRYEGLSIPEIAGRLGLTDQNVRKHLSLANKDLREVLTVFAAFLALVH